MTRALRVAAIATAVVSFLSLVAANAVTAVSLQDALI